MPRLGCLMLVQFTLKLIPVCLFSVGGISAEPAQRNKPEAAYSQGGSQPSLAADINKRDRHGATALHWMAFQGRLDIVERLISDGAGVNDRVDKGSTPLHLAAYNGHAAVVETLIRHGAKVNAPTHSGITPLYWARRNGHTTVAELLVSHGAVVGTPEKAAAVDKTAAPGIEPITSGLAQLAANPGDGKAGPDAAAVRLEDLREVSRVNRILAKYRTTSTSPETPPGQDRGPAEANQQQQSAAQPGRFQFQLGAFSSRQRGLQALTNYSQRYPEILAKQLFKLEPVTINGKTLFRVRSTLVPREQAVSVCAQLTEHGQSCFVVKSEST